MRVYESIRSNRLHKYADVAGECVTVYMYEYVCQQGGLDAATLCSSFSLTPQPPLSHKSKPRPMQLKSDLIHLSRYLPPCIVH